MYKRKLAGIQSGNLLLIYRFFGSMNEMTMGPDFWFIFLLVERENRFV